VINNPSIVRFLV